MIPTANMKLFVDILYSLGLASLNWVVVEFIYTLFRVLSRVPANTAMKITIRAIEQNPPVAVSNSGSSSYRRATPFVNKSNGLKIYFAF